MKLKLHDDHEPSELRFHDDHEPSNLRLHDDHEPSDFWLYCQVNTKGELSQLSPLIDQMLIVCPLCFGLMANRFQYALDL